LTWKRQLEEIRETKNVVVKKAKIMKRLQNLEMMRETHRKELAIAQEQWVKIKKQSN
jgi:hypothetical protein